MLIHSLKRIKKPQALPVTLQEAKIFLKIDNDLEDNLLLNMIGSAVDSFEDYTAVALMPQHWSVIYKKINNVVIELPIKPVIAIKSISQMNLDLEEKQIAKYKFLRDTVFLPYLPVAEFIKIDFQAGHVDETQAIEEDIKLAILEHVSFCYVNRDINKKINLNRYSRFRSIAYAV